MKNKNCFEFGHGDKRIRLFPLLFLLPFLFLLTSCKQEIALSNHLEVRAEIGYDKTVSLSEGNPVKFSISNAGEDFKGEIRIFVPLDYDSDTAYVIPIEIAANSQKTVEEYLPLYIVNKEFKYEIRSKGVTIREGLLNATNFLNPTNMRIAIISEDPDKYNFFKSTGLIRSPASEDEIITYEFKSADLAAPEPTLNPNDQPKSYYKNFTVHQKNMAKFSNKAALNFFDVIFIGDLSELALSEEGLQNLLAWVDKGGILIVETGENFEKMQRLLPEELKLIDFDTVADEKIKMESFQGTLKLAKGTNKRENVSEFEINGSKLLYFKNAGAGKIVTFNTLIGEGPLQEQGLQAKYVSAVMEAIPTLFDNYQREDIGAGRYNLGVIPISGEIPFQSIGMLLLIYSLGVIPLTYKILKNKKKQSLMWIVGPATSLLLILIISQIGSLTWGNRPITNEMSIIEYHQSQNYLKIKSELGLFNNRKGEMKISWDKDENIEIFDSDFNNRYYTVVEDQRVAKPSLSSARYMQNPPLYYNYETGLWDFVIARAEKIVKINDKGTHILLKDGEKGETIRIKNGLPMDLKSTILYWHNKYYSIGDLESGEEREFQMNLLKGETEFYKIRYETENDIESYNIEDYIQSKHISRYDKPLLFCFSKEPAGYKIRINDESSKCFAGNLVVLHLDLNIEDGSNLLLNEAEYKNMSAVYTDRENIAIESRQETVTSYHHSDGYSLVQIPNSIDRKNQNLNSLVTEFKLPSNLEIKSFRIDFNTNSLETMNSAIDLSNSQHIPIENPDDRYFIFNYAENKYDELYLKDFSLEDYVDSDGLVKNLEASESAMMNVDWDMFLKAKFYEVKNPNYIGRGNLVRIKVLKPKFFEYGWFELRQNEIEIKGVYHD